MKIHKDDTVKIIAGKDKGKTGKVLKVLLEEGKVIVEGINLVKRHVKPGTISKEGGVVTIEKPINVSNVMYFDAQLNRPVRIGYTIVDGKKYRLNKVNKEVLK